MGYSKRYLSKFIFYRFQWMVSSIIWPWFLFQEKFFPPNAARILTYHCVSNFPQEKAIPYDNVAPHLFSTHMNILKKDNFNVIRLIELVRILQAGMNVPPKTVVITFDDGYQNNYLNALPILEESGYKATFFIIADGMRMQEPFPHLLWDEAAENCYRLNPGSRMPMSEAEVRNIKKCGHDIGSHGMTHRSIGNLSLIEAMKELTHSKEILEKAVGGQVSLFSYPFGARRYNDLNRKTAAMLRSFGYEAACTSDIGPVTGRNDLYEMPRIPVRETDNSFRFRQKLCGAFDWVNPFKNIFQKTVPRIDNVT